MTSASAADVLNEAPPFDAIERDAPGIAVVANETDTGDLPDMRGEVESAAQATSTVPAASETRIDWVDDIDKLRRRWDTKPEDEMVSSHS
jgi:hypothetical protein